jgi:hypothetical protein
MAELKKVEYKNMIYLVENYFLYRTIDLFNIENIFVSPQLSN